MRFCDLSFKVQPGHEGWKGAWGQQVDVEEAVGHLGRLGGQLSPYSSAALFSPRSVSLMAWLHSRVGPVIFKHIACSVLSSFKSFKNKSTFIDKWNPRLLLWLSPPRSGSVHYGQAAQRGLGQFFCFSASRSFPEMEDAVPELSWRAASAAGPCCPWSVWWSPGWGVSWGGGW